MINPQQKVERKSKNFRLAVSAIATLDSLADAYNSTPSKIMEALLAQYGPKLMEMRKEGAQV